MRNFFLLFLAVISLSIAWFGHFTNTLLAMCLDEMFGEYLMLDAVLWLGFSVLTFAKVLGKDGKNAKAVWTVYALIMLVIALGAIYKAYNKDLFHDHQFRPETIIELLKGEESQRFKPK